VPGADALAALEIALADVDPQVRVAAAIMAGRHPEGASLAGPLIEALDDVPEVQLAASRSLGYLHVESATAALTGLLASGDADVRVSSLQAIDRIDPAYAEGLSQLAALVADADPTDARAAQKIAAR
jgi:HEAT repeat protein